MGSKHQLGRLQQIDDLREIWRTEARDFTPWLAEEDNLALLGDAIGLDLELESTEKDVGPFRADILCKETGTDHWVLIENQTERTDHTHLGQILTYAAGLNAVTIVWIARQFSDEHRATLDWLNDVTGDAVSFFGLEIELWRIGDSPIAPKFNIVSKPNEWTKGGGGPGAGDLTPSKKLQLEYWTAFRRMALDRGTFLGVRKPLVQPWTVFSLGRSGFQLVAFFSLRSRCIGVGIELKGDDRDAHYHLLLAERASIEAEIDVALRWEHRPKYKSNKVFLLKTKVDSADRSDWPQQHAWLVAVAEKFHQAFRPRVMELDAGEWEPEDGDAE